MDKNASIINALTGGQILTTIMNVKLESPQKRISDERIRHMHGVAELMYQFHDVFQCNVLDPEECYLLGLNHDIGYINGKEGHERYGGEIFSNIVEYGSRNPFVEYIGEHGTTPSEYMKYYLRTEEEIPHELILLWWADMCVVSCGDRAGEIVSFQENLDILGKHYGMDSEPYRICKETMEWLADYMSRHF